MKSWWPVSVSDNLQHIHSFIHSLHIDTSARGRCTCVRCCLLGQWAAAFTGFWMKAEHWLTHWLTDWLIDQSLRSCCTDAVTANECVLQGKSACVNNLECLRRRDQALPSIFFVTQKNVQNTTSTKIADTDFSICLHVLVNLFALAVPSFIGWSFYWVEVENYRSKKRRKPDPSHSFASFWWIQKIQPIIGTNAKQKLFGPK